jgi:phage minor structural protein
MQFVVFNNKEEVVAFMSGELPGACAPVSARRNLRATPQGGYEDTLDFKVPSDHSDAAHIQKDSYIGFIDPDGYFQKYKVVDCSQVRSGGQVYTQAYLEHDFYELIGDQLRDVRPTDKLAAEALTQVLQGTRWAVGSVDSFPTKSTRIYEVSVLEGLLHVASVWGGELRFRLTFSGTQITGRYVDLLSRRGSTTGKRFEYGKDLIETQSVVNTQGLCTALIGRGKGVQIDDDAYGRRLKFTDVVWSVAEGDPVDKPAGQDWVGDEDAKESYGSAGGTRHITQFANFEDCEDAEELLQLTYNKLQAVKVPKVTYKLKVIDLERLAGFEHESTRFGDSVYVIDTKANPSIEGEARVIEHHINLLIPSARDNEVVLGNYIPSMQTLFAQVKTTQDGMNNNRGSWDRAGSAIDIVEAPLSDLHYKIDLLKTQLLSTISGVSTDAAGNILIENPAKTMALKLGAGIFAIANSRLGDGSYDWKTFGDGNGFTADLMTAGTLQAGIVFAGTLWGASGYFTSLIAGLDTAQRLHQGIDEFGDPFIKIYSAVDPNTPSLIINQRGITFPNGADFQQFNKGTRQGLGVFAM